MRLFDDFEIIKFSEENLLFVTHNGFLYYIYDPKNKYWRKHKNAGNDHLTVSNYEDVGRDEIIDAMKGKFPEKETDFLRQCNPSCLRDRDLFRLLEEDYPQYLIEDTCYHYVHSLLSESSIPHKVFSGVKTIFDCANARSLQCKDVIPQIKELCFTILGRDIYKSEIRIVDGHESSSYFWIMPVRVVDYSDTDSTDNIAEMSSNEISIEEDDVAQYLTPFLYRYFDEAHEANKNRRDAGGFEWNLTYNFFTFESVRKILKDISDTAEALSSGIENEYTVKLRKKRGMATYTLLYAKNLTDDEVRAYNESRPTEDDTEIELIIDFYRRFTYRMEYMMRVGAEKGYDLISFMGP